MKPSILYYTRPCYLDAALEYINVAKSDYDIHVVIQLSASELKSNIINITSAIDKYPPIVSYASVKEDWKLQFLQPYFDDCKSVNFLIFQQGVESAIKTSRALGKFINHLDLQYLHFDDFTGKQLFVLPSLLRNRNKLVLNVHDPKPHTGEFSVSRFLIQRLLYGLPKKLVVFSNYSKEIISPQIKSPKVVYVLRLLPYTVFKHFSADHNKGSDGLISFVGRLSPYKGVDIFIDAIQSVINFYPNQKFLIAGKTLFGYELDREKLNKLKDNLIVDEKHLTNEEMVSHILNSKVIVCPYLDATQSGVLMAAFALRRPVIVTNVGGLPEYIFNDDMGLVSQNADAKSISDTIKEFLLHSDNSQINELAITKMFELEARKNSKVMKSIYS